MESQTGVLIKRAKERQFDWKPETIWQWLTAPPDDVVPAMRRRMQVLSTALLLLAPLALVAVLISHQASAPGGALLANPVSVIGLSADVLLWISYLLSRVRRMYPIAVALSLTTIVMGSIFATFVSPKEAATLLVFTSVTILMSSLLLPVWGTITLAVVINLLELLLPTVIPSLAISTLTNILLFNVMIAMLCIVTAIVRQRDLEQIEEQAHRLTEAIVVADETNMLKSQFLATMSHELRTPLNAIIGFTEVMMMGLAGNLDPEAKRTTERIHHNGERLLELIDDLLDISKIEAGRLEVLREEFSPGDLLSDAERVTRPLALEKGLGLVVEIDPAVPSTVVGDAQRIGQVLHNLLTNAVKFTDQGSIRVSVAQPDTRHWSIAVVDTGIGIPVHAQEFIFEKFRQVDGTSRRAYGGTGLGLAIVKELVALMDGTVSLQSTVGGGSTFTVILPLIVPGKGRALDE